MTRNEAATLRLTPSPRGDARATSQVTMPRIAGHYTGTGDLVAALLLAWRRAARAAGRQKRLAPQPIKVRSDVEVTCFTYEGIDAVRDSLMAGTQDALPNWMVYTDEDGTRHDIRPGATKEDLPYIFKFMMGEWRAFRERKRARRRELRLGVAL